MKVSQGIIYWLEYHKLHSKKKHSQNLPVDPFKIDRPIWRKGPELSYPIGNPVVSHPNQSGDQTDNQKDSVLPTDLFLQLHHPKS